MIFAGRKEYVETQFKNTDMLIVMQLVSEVHVWDFVVNENDPNEECSSKYSVMGYRLFLCLWVIIREEKVWNQGTSLFRFSYAHYS